MRLLVYGLLLITVIASAATPQAALGHPIGTSGFRFLLYPDHAKAILTLHTVDLVDWLDPATNGDDVCKQLLAERNNLLAIRFDQNAISPSTAGAHVIEDGLIQVELTFPMKTAPKQIELWSKHLIHLPAGHQQLLIVEDMRARPTGLSAPSVYEAALSREDDHVTIDVPPPPPIAPPPATSQPFAPTTTEQAPSPRTPGRSHLALRGWAGTALLCGAILAILLWFCSRRAFKNG